MSLPVFVSTLSGNMRMATQSRYSTSTRSSTSRCKLHLRQSAERLITFHRSRPARKPYHSPLFSASSRKNQRVNAGCMHHKLRGKVGMCDRSHMQEQEASSHQLPFPSLLQEAIRRVTAIKQEAYVLLHIIQNNPLTGNRHAHQSGARACHTICAEM